MPYFPNLDVEITMLHQKIWLQSEKTLITGRNVLP